MGGFILLVICCCCCQSPVGSHAIVVGMLRSRVLPPMTADVAGKDPIPVCHKIMELTLRQSHSDLDSTATTSTTTTTATTH